MLFNSVHFFIFLPVVLAVYFLLSHQLAKRVWLLFASLYFYAVFRVPFLLLLVFCFTFTYSVVLWMSRTKARAGRVFLLNLAIWGNVSLLYFFKYIDFSFVVWNKVLGLEPCDPWYAQAPGVLLPMGISFFVLQAVAYTVDVYRGEVGPAKSFLQFVLFKSFFPQLVAGPIIRAKDCMDQFLEGKQWNTDNFHLGLRQMVLGFFKKTLIADPVSNLIDPIFHNPGAYDWVSMWIAAGFFAIQVYCDFAGYSDIAIGTAKMLGYHLPKNFDRPFLSPTVTELWRRWHISYASWLRDYLYIPLGGSKVSAPRAYFNVFITMFVSGIWHGADWTYVVWGTIHAMLMVIERFIFGFAAVKNTWARVPRVLQPLYPFFVFTVSMFFFRAKLAPGFDSGVSVAFYMMKKAFSFADGQLASVPLALVGLIALLFAIESFKEKNDGAFDRIFAHRWALYSLAFVVLGVCFLVYSVTVSQPFLYFQF